MQRKHFRKASTLGMVSFAALAAAAGISHAQDRTDKSSILEALGKAAKEEAARALEKAILPAEADKDEPVEDAVVSDEDQEDGPSENNTNSETITVAEDKPKQETPVLDKTVPVRSPQKVAETSRAVEQGQLDDDRPIIMQNADLPEFTNSEVLLFIDDNGNNARKIASDSGLQLVSSRRIGLLDTDLVVLRVPEDDDVQSALSRLRARYPDIWVQPNYIYQLLGNSRSDGLAMHGLTREAALLPSGLPPIKTGATIAMVDSPVDRTHPSLARADIRQSNQFGTIPPSPHGTAIAELLVGDGEFEGVVRDATLVSIPAFRPIDTKDWHSPSTSTTMLLTAALDQAHEAQPDVLNLSFGTLAAKDDAIGKMLTLLHETGLCIVAAAGNGGPNSPVLFPASIEATVAVGAVDTNERSYPKGSRGPEIDIAAWGVDISAAVPGGRRAVSGTSFAAPLVAGAMLRMPACTQTRNPAAARAALAMDAKDLGESGRDPVFGAGLLRFKDAALASAQITPATLTQPGKPAEGSDNILMAGAGAAAVSGLFLAFILWRRRKKREHAKHA